MKKRKKNLYETLILCYLACALPIIKRHTPDNDLYFLIATGREILENGIPYTNPFHLTDGLEMIVQQWTGCILDYLVFTNAGNTGLFTLTLIYVAFHLWTTISLTGLFTNSKKTKIIILLTTFLGMYPFFNIRGSLLTSALLMWEVYFLIKYIRSRKAIYLLSLPLISLIIINWQMASWPLIFPIVFMFFLPGKVANITNYYKEQKKSLGRLLVAVSVSAAAGLINPYGIKGMTYLLNSLGMIDDYVAEFTNVEANSLSAYLSLYQFAFLIIYCFRKKEKTDLRYVGLSILALLLSITIKRNTWFCLFAIPTTVVAADWLWENETIKELLKLFLPSKKKGYICTEIFLWISIIILFSLSSHLSYSPANIEYNNRYVPKSAVLYLETVDNKENIRLMTEFNNGGYFAWHGYKIYIDARPELYTLRMNKKANIYTEYRKTRENALYLSAEISKYGFTHIITQKNTPVYFFMMEQDDYKAVLSPKLDYQLFEKIEKQENRELPQPQEKQNTTLPINPFQKEFV